MFFPFCRMQQTSILASLRKIKKTLWHFRQRSGDTLSRQPQCNCPSSNSSLLFLSRTNSLEGTPDGPVGSGLTLISGWGQRGRILKLGHGPQSHSWACSQRQQIIPAGSLYQGNFRCSLQWTESGCHWWDGVLSEDVGISLTLSFWLCR